MLGSQVSSKDGEKYIPVTLKCNGHRDCADGSDEENCVDACHANEFKCQNGEKCIENTLRCNRRQGDCSDGSDEENCVDECPVNEFKCHTLRLHRC